MIPLLFPFLADTVIAPPMDYSEVFVNEWGVVVFTAGGTTVAGAPGEDGGLEFGREPFGPLLVDAPVIWIHGAFFQDATLTVKAVQGELTALYPEPHSVEDESYPVEAEWRISSPPPVPLTERPTPPEPGDLPFAWAMPLWRDVPSRDLFDHETGDYLGNFLYYEAGILFWNPPDDIYDPEILAGHYSPEGLAITVGDEPQVRRHTLVPLPGGSSSADQLADDEVLEVICGWAGGRLKSQEIEALWNTWKPFFQTESACDELAYDRRGEGELWMLFPLPWDEVEKISTLELVIHGRPDLMVSYNRMFLGLVRVY